MQEVADTQQLGPVELLIRRDHAFKKKADDPETGRKRIGCEVCDAGRLRRQHLGAPPSMNDGGSGMDRNAYQALKRAWQAALGDALRESGLPLGLEAVAVEGLVGFPTRTGRDQGNHRWMVEKALGDALAEGGWIADDTFFPVSRYEFGGLQAVHTPGESWLRLLVMPRAAEDRSLVMAPTLVLDERVSTALVRPLRAAAWELRAAWATGRRVSLTLERADVVRLEGTVRRVAATDATVTVAGRDVPLDRVLAVHLPSRLGDSTVRGGGPFHGAGRRVVLPDQMEFPFALEER